MLSGRSILRGVTDANLARYAAVVFLSTTGDVLDAAQQAFRGGPPHPLGRTCVSLPECAERCEE